MRDSLIDAGIPAVVSGNVSVFHTKAGDDWLVLLEALEQPHRSGRVRAAALTPFVGRTAAELAAGGDGLTDELSALFSRWAAVLAARGVAALLEVAATEQDLPARMLGRVGGERQLTDLRHVGQALHAAAVEEGLGLAALTEWLRRRRADTRARRSPPTGSAGSTPTPRQPRSSPCTPARVCSTRWCTCRSPSTGSSAPRTSCCCTRAAQRVLDIGGPGTPGRAERQRQALAEEAGEALRHLYVGLTRAQSQVVTWWAPTKNTTCSGLHRVLFGDRDCDRRRARRGAAGHRRRRRAATAGAGSSAAALVVERAAVGVRPTGDPPPRCPTPTSRSAFSTASLDDGWRRVSYSSLSAAGFVRARTVLVRGCRYARVDQPATPGRQRARGHRAAGRGDPAVRHALPAADDAAARGAVADGGPAGRRDVRHPGARGAGDHRPAGAGPAGRTAGAIAPSSSPGAGRPFTAEQLAAALLPVLRTPLGPLAAGVTLRDIGLGTGWRRWTSRCRWPAATGVDGAASRWAQLAPVIRRHLAAGRPARRVRRPPGVAGVQLAAAARVPHRQPGRVLRLPGPRYLVADYKTNWLGDIDAAAAVRLALSARRRWTR